MGRPRGGRCNASARRLLRCPWEGRTADNSKLPAARGGQSMSSVAGSRAGWWVPAELTVPRLNLPLTWKARLGASAESAEEHLHKPLQTVNKPRTATAFHCPLELPPPRSLCDTERGGPRAAAARCPRALVGRARLLARSEKGLARLATGEDGAIAATAAVRPGGGALRGAIAATAAALSGALRAVSGSVLQLVRRHRRSTQYTRRGC